MGPIESQWRFQDHHHENSLWAHAGDDVGFRSEVGTRFSRPVPGFPKAILNDLDSVKAHIDDETVAIMLEPNGEAGVMPATREFMQGLRALADEHGLLLIVDECRPALAAPAR